MSKRRQHVATTEEVLFAYQGEGDGGFAFNPDHSEEGFYAWLNEERAKVWDQGWKSGFTDMTGYLTGPPTCNPYREGVE